jgi:hypothetical protein
MANTKISALTTFIGDTTGVYVVIDNSGLTQTYKITIDALLASLSGITSTGNVSGQYLISTNATGNEGGEIQLAKPPNSTLSGGTTIDAYVNQVRIFEQGGNARGVSLDLSKAPIGVGGELMWKTSNYVNVGTFVTLDNVKATVTTAAQGNRGLSLATVSGSFTANIGGTYSRTDSSNGGAAGVQTITTTASSSVFNWNFPGQADTSTYIISDTTNSRVYRVILMVGGSYINNFISIERLY